VYSTRCVRDVPDWRLHHHGCEQVAALHQARCPRVVHGARVCHQRTFTKTLLDARWEFPGCVWASGLHHQSTCTRTLRQARWEFPGCVWASGLHHQSTSTRTLPQARCQRVVHGARVCHQRKRTRTLHQTRWEYKGCVRSSRVHHTRKSTWTLLQTRWGCTGCVYPSRLHHQSSRTGTLQEARWPHFQTLPCTRLSYLRNRARALLQARCTWGVPRTRLHLQSASQRMVQEAQQPVSFQEMKVCTWAVGWGRRGAHLKQPARAVRGDHGAQFNLWFTGWCTERMCWRARTLPFDRTHLLPIRTCSTKELFCVSINL
jgi:hypothetical protein